MNSAFVGYEEFCRSRRVLSTFGGCYPPSASVDNTLLDLQNSSYPTQPHSIIAKYYLWHVRVLSIKPCLHTQLPEHNKSYQKVSRGWGYLITWNGPMMGHLNSFSASGGGNLNKNFPKIQMPGGCPGGMLKLRFDWYIIGSGTQAKN